MTLNNPKFLDAEEEDMAIHKGLADGGPARRTSHDPAGHDAEHDAEHDLLARSYGWMRLSIGLAAISLPLILILVDRFITTDDRFLTNKNDVRDSMSAYYHTAARDVFVGGLCVVGVLLLTYRLGQLRPLRGWARARVINAWLMSFVSLLAGAAVIVVALVPTARDVSGEPARQACTSLNGCTALQQRWGEAVVADWHGAAALTFTVCLFVMCLLFAWEERLLVKSWKSRRNYFHGFAALLILLAGACLLFDWTLPTGFWGFSLAKVYLAEFLAFGGFAVSWLAVAKAITQAHRRLDGLSALHPLELPRGTPEQASADRHELE